MTPKELADELRDLQRIATKCPPGNHYRDEFNSMIWRNYDTILAALDAHEPWVKCSERMPPPKTPVLVRLHDYWDVCQADEYLPGRYNWVIDRETRYVAEAVTHWKPLPKPPEEI